jgi:hypothetical protein
MEKYETNQLMKLLSITYPNTYKDFTDAQKIETMTLYYDFFGGYETDIVVQALKNYIKVNQYPPTIAGLQEQIDHLTGSKTAAAELWNAIAKACKNSCYGAVVEFEKLPTECQKWLGGPSALKDLALVDPQIFATVVRGEFLKSIGKIQDREEAVKGLPDEVRRAINQSRMQLEGGYE